MASNSPIPTTRLKQIANDACDSALSTSTIYDHAQTESWNNQIINTILKALISESSNTSTSSSEPPARYKFAVTSTIIQHLADPRPAGTEDGESVSAAKKVGRRGMHSAVAAYWNNERDGMFSHKYEGGESKGMDIVISIMWIGV